MPHSVRKALNNATISFILVFRHRDRLSLSRLTRCAVCWSGGRTRTWTRRRTRTRCRPTTSPNQTQSGRISCAARGSPEFFRRKCRTKLFTSDRDSLCVKLEGLVSGLVIISSVCATALCKCGRNQFINTTFTRPTKSISKSM